MRIEGPESLQRPAGAKGPSAAMLRTVCNLTQQSDSLELTLSIVKKAQHSQLSSSQPAPTNNYFQKYIDDLINYLTTVEHIPAGALQFLKNEAAGIDPTLPRSGTQMLQILHQIFAIGSQVDPSFVQKVTSAISDPKEIAGQAAQQIKTLQAEMQNLISSFGAQGKLFQDFINIQSFLMGIPSNLSDGAAFQKFADSIADLASHTKDPSPWAGAVSSILTSLSGVKNGVSLSDVVATAMMLEMYSSHGSGQTFAYAESAMKAPLEKAIAQMEGTNVPFFQAIATKLGWWQHHLDGSYMEPYCDESAGSGMLVGSLKRNWTAILAKSCSFSQSSISTALNQIDTTINQLEGGQYQQLSQQLAQAEQAQSAMQNLLNGDWSIAFPSGPYVQGPTAPDGYFESIQDVIAALSKILLSQKSDPMVQQLLNQLWQVTSGPPYPATIVSTVQMIAQSYSAIHPLTADQKQMIQTAFTKMDQNIQAMTKRREDLTPLVQLFNAISKDLKGFPNCTAQNYEDAASLIWKLIQMDVGATDPAQSQMINKFFSTLMSSSPEMAGEMGILFYDAQLANGVKPSDLHDIMEQFQKSHPNLYKDCPFADKFVYQIIIDSHPPPSKSDPESTINSIKNIFSQPGSGQTYWSKISSQSQACQDEYNQLQQEITQQKEVEQELKSAFGGLN